VHSRWKTNAHAWHNQHSHRNARAFRARLNSSSRRTLGWSDPVPKLRFRFHASHRVSISMTTAINPAAERRVTVSMPIGIWVARSRFDDVPKAVFVVALHIPRRFVL
jgi:hypothetical protein